MDGSLEKIYKAGLKFLVPLTPEETYRIIVHEAIKLVSGDHGSIFLEEEGHLKEVCSSLSDSSLKVRRRGFTYRAFDKRISFVIGVKQLERAHPHTLVKGIKSVIFIPLSYKNRSIGVLSVRSNIEGKFDKNEPDILKLFGSMASLAIRKTQLYNEEKKALETRDLFLSMAAHEFRTPLTTISGYAQLLASKSSKKNSTQSRWIEGLLLEAARLTTLVNELLEISRIHSGKFQYVLRECSLEEIIKRAILAIKFSYPDRKFVFQNKIDSGKDIVVGDADKLLQVFINLLDNAAKFSAPETEIIITLKFRSPYLVIMVKDHGRGIENKDLPRIFDSFYRGNKTGVGMGLGLFLANAIVEQHHGTINIHSKIDKGTTVEVLLPNYSLII